MSSWGELADPGVEVRFDCCPTPPPIVYQDHDDRRAWEVLCVNCSTTLCYLTAPDPVDSDDEGATDER